MALHHIAVEGPIGVGKTTVVERLAERLEARTLLEDWSTNPFLRPSTTASPGAAFQTELFFLLSRYRQQQELLQRQLFTQATLVDYVFEKSRLFAYLNLDDSELLIFDKLYALLSPRACRGRTSSSTCRRRPRCCEAARRRAGAPRRASSRRSTWPR